MPDGGTTIIIQGKSRFAVDAIVSEEPSFKAKVSAIVEEEAPKDPDFEAYVANIKDVATESFSCRPTFLAKHRSSCATSKTLPFSFIFVSSNLTIDIKEKQQLLQLNNLRERAELLMQFLQKELQFAELKNKGYQQDEDGDRQTTTRLLFTAAVKSIKEELGGDPNEREVKELQKRAEAKKWPEAAREAFKKGIEKLERMHPSTPDYSVIYNHVDLMLDLPWEDYTQDVYDLKKAKEILDNDHYGMEKIKERILEYLAVLKTEGRHEEPYPVLLRSAGHRQNIIREKHCGCHRAEVRSVEPGRHS